MSDTSNNTRSNVDPVGPVAALNPPTGTPHEKIESLMQELNDIGGALMALVLSRSILGTPSMASLLVLISSVIVTGYKSLGP